MFTEPRNITKKIRDKNIIDNLSLTIKRGEVAVLLGPSGVGKSTLLRVLNNLEPISAGIIELDGAPLNLSIINQHHTIGMVFQHFNLFEHLTVEQNISLALEHVAHKTQAEAHAIAMALLQLYGLAEKAHAAIAQLSGGQKQRLAIARTLALKPIIICLDEPTSALDPLLTGSVADAIKELAQQEYIVLVATHDIRLLEKLPCTIHFIQNGAIIESADSSRFFQRKEDYPHLAAFVTGQHAGV